MPFQLGPSMRSDALLTPMTTSSQNREQDLYANNPFLAMPRQDTSGMERLATIQNNVRNLLQQDFGTPAPSSLYSGSPNPNPNPTSRGVANEETPRPSPRRSLFGRLRGLGSWNTPQQSQSNWPLPLHTPGQRTEYSPASEPSEWSRLPDEPELAAQSTFRHPADTVPIVYSNDGERDLEAQIPQTSHRSKKHKRRRRRQQRRRGVWTMKRGQRGPTKSGTCFPLLHGHTRVKTMTCIVSGLFLASILTIYLTIALTIKGLGQELHVLFILSIIGTTIFFAHSVIRLCIMALRPPRERRRGLIPSVAGPEGFAPDVPIQVQLARDEEIAAQLEDGRFDEEKIESIAQPPPAYGLWRCSVRINPNLLHWQRVAGENSPESPVNDGARSPPGSPTYPIVPSPIASSLHPILETRDGQPRPPSYISDDGVSYVVSALPGRPPSEIHPAFRIRLP